MTSTNNSQAKYNHNDDRVENEVQREKNNVCLKKISASPAWTRIVSGSIGSVVTALVVTPLEVVKVRQQAGLEAAALPSPPFSSGAAAATTRKNGIIMCPKQCGTFVFSNGISECVLPRNAVPHFNLQQQQPKLQQQLGTFSMVRKIFMTEGLSGIYAGLSPTLVMGVPNTVIYFVAYDELVARAKQLAFLNQSTNIRNINDSHINNGNSNNFHWWIPPIAGGMARLVASTVTSPMEFIRTRQASRVGSGQAPIGAWADLTQLVRSDGILSLFRGLTPTLARDVPFSAVYWFCLEQMRLQWKQYHYNKSQRQQQQHQKYVISSHQQAFQEFVNGAVAGMIAAACTTPLDVVKTRRQMVTNIAAVQSTTATATATAATCNHGGATVAFAPISTPTQVSGGVSSVGTWQMLKTIAQTEGVKGLWRGNQTRMIKVAPACAIMITCYEMGKRLLLSSTTSS